MGLDARHPLFNEFLPDWEQMRDTSRSERRVKEAGIRYLSPTAGMVADGMKRLEDKGWKAYEAYRRRARFPSLVKDAVKALVGVMHSKEATIELPSAMEGLLKRATLRNESLQMLLRRINLWQLVLGRVGIMGDFIDSAPDESGATADRAGEPYIALYAGDKIINWDDGTTEEDGAGVLNLVVIDESRNERGANLEWQNVQKFRVLVLGEVDENEPGGVVYRAGVFRETTQLTEEGLMVPVVRNEPFNEIPFEFINAADIVAEPEEPPLLGLSDLSLGIYRGEADYRQSLFMQGQDTLVTIGGPETDEDIRTGAGARINIPNTDGDAKFIGVDSAGLSEQREALQNDKNEGKELSGQLLDTVSRERESGEALKVRVAARTATLNQVALAGAFGLESLLKKIARWMGLNEDEVVVTPNLDFVDDTMTGEELAQFMGAKMLKAPLSIRSIHELMQERGVTARTLEEELEEIENERDTILFESADDEPGTTNPDGPVDDGGEGGGGGGQTEGQPQQGDNPEGDGGEE